MVYAAVRLRGKVNVKPKIKDTLNLLNLTKTNHCVIIPEEKNYKGMLQIVKDYITWGEINQETLEQLISNRGRLKGDKPLTDEYIKKETSFTDIKKLSKALMDGKTKYKEIPEVKPLFRLNPPEKGLRSIKRSFNKKGSIGYRGNDINDLIKRMV